MAFYDLSKEDRIRVVTKMNDAILSELEGGKFTNTHSYFSDEDTYIRRSAYLSVGRLYFKNKSLQPKIIQMLDEMLLQDDFKMRQTAINAAGEIGKKDFCVVQHFFDKGLFDPHHSPRNAVIGSIKKMGEVNPEPVLAWAKRYLHHPDKEIRREICHGIELRGRKFPQDILPLLQELQHDTAARVRSTLIHVIGQIAYKSGCLKIVIAQLNGWSNKALVAEALEEIIDVHHRYRDFAAMTQSEARQYLATNYRRGV